jgi:hypothetical protein
VTLSENARERLWVAEIVEGNETRVAMVTVDLGVVQKSEGRGGLMLRKSTVMRSNEPVLAALETADGMVVVESETIAIYGHRAGEWQVEKRVAIAQKGALARDPRGVISASAIGEGFEASVAGMDCTGSYVTAEPMGEWTVRCRETDDPWTLAVVRPDGPSGIKTGESGGTLKAFYNTARDYFTGVVTPGIDVDLPPFYSAALVPRASGAGLVINGVDGKVELAENGRLKPVSGTRDWGSDFAALNSGCGAGTQIVASGSGEAASDSLRAYELPGQEATPASAPLAMEGTVTAVWTAPDGQSLFAVVKNPAGQYEVDRVTASCN